MSPRWLLLCTGAVALVPQTPLARRSVTLSAKAGTFPAYENPKKGALGAKSLLPDEADAVVQAAPAPAPPPPPPVEKIVEKPVAKPVAKAVAPAPSPAPKAYASPGGLEVAGPFGAFAVLAGVVAWRAKATEEESAEEPTPAPKLASYPAPEPTPDSDDEVVGAGRRARSRVVLGRSTKIKKAMRSD